MIKSYPVGCRVYSNEDDLREVAEGWVWAAVIDLAACGDGRFKSLIHGRITRTPCRSNGAMPSAVAPASVISVWISLVGQMKAGPTLPSLLESATTISCFDCFSILR